MIVADAAFQVINDDALNDTTQIQPLPSHALPKLNKPNVVVYPTRRVHVDDARAPNAPLAIKLHEKLRQMTERIQNLTSIGSSARLNLIKPDVMDVERKPFRTVVRQGTFLKPPPAIATRLLLEAQPVNDGRNDKVLLAKRMYAYVSRPKIARNRDAKSGDSRLSTISASSRRALDSWREDKTDVDENVVRFRRAVDGTWGVDGPNYGNIMYDKRVCRGNTYSPYTQTDRAAHDADAQLKRQQEARRRVIARKRVADKKMHYARMRLASPPAYDGTKHENVQTDMHIEEFTDEPCACDVVCQTELFLERATDAVYVPAGNCVDAATQIFPNDLFDFDTEVEPIIEQIVGKTIEQSLVDVLEEEELESLREQQRRFEEMRNAQFAEVNRLERVQRALKTEKNRAIAEHMEGVERQQTEDEAILKASLMQSYVADLLPDVLDNLKTDGFNLENVRKGIEEGFMPWLAKEVAIELEQMVASRDMLTDLVRDVLETRRDIYSVLDQ